MFFLDQYLHGRMVLGYIMTVLYLLFSSVVIQVYFHEVGVLVINNLIFFFNNSFTLNLSRLQKNMVVS